MGDLQLTAHLHTLRCLRVTSNHDSCLLPHTLTLIPAPTDGGRRPLGHCAPAFQGCTSSGSNGQKRKDFNMANWVQLFLGSCFLKKLINGNLVSELQVVPRNLFFSP